MKIMIPKTMRVANNYFLFPFYYICDCFHKCFHCKGTCCRRNFPFLKKLNISWGTGTTHRGAILATIIYTILGDVWRYSPYDLLKASVRSGGTLSASSSWLPLYPLDNAILHEEVYTNNPNINLNKQSSWCANFNSTYEWIQVSVP
jgi:hypothetical protein